MIQRLPNPLFHGLMVKSSKGAVLKCNWPPKEITGAAAESVEDVAEVVDSVAVAPDVAAEEVEAIAMEVAVEDLETERVGRATGDVPVKIAAILTSRGATNVIDAVRLNQKEVRAVEVEAAIDVAVRHLEDAIDEVVGAAVEEVVVDLEETEMVVDPWVAAEDALGHQGAEVVLEVEVAGVEWMVVKVGIVLSHISFCNILLGNF
uniref:Uncharacterized protein n=1 Tax=Photinus pyralis TaxID=7054 RepID=A0A1Y1KUQ0_PHOPY